MTDPLRSKALACLREGRVTVLAIQRDGDVPDRVLARVRSSRDDYMYRVEFRAGAWTCGCRNGLRDETCGHVEAVRLVTRAEVTV